MGDVPLHALQYFSVPFGCTWLCSVLVILSSTPTASLAGTCFTGFPEHTNNCLTLPPGLSTPIQHNQRGITTLQCPWKQSPTPCCNIMLQTTATTLHLSNKVATSIAFILGYYINVMHYLFKIDFFCRKIILFRARSSSALLWGFSGFDGSASLSYSLLPRWVSSMWLFCFPPLKGHLDKCHLPFKS